MHRFKPGVGDSPLSANQYSLDADCPKIRNKLNNADILGIHHRPGYGSCCASPRLILGGLGSYSGRWGLGGGTSLFLSKVACAERKHAGPRSQVLNMSLWENDAVHMNSAPPFCDYGSWIAGFETRPQIWPHNVIRSTSLRVPNL